MKLLAVLAAALALLAPAVAEGQGVGGTQATYLPQLLAGAELYTELRIKNLSATKRRQVSVGWTSPGGRPMGLWDQDGPTWGFAVNIPPGGVFTEILKSKDGLQVGWARFTQPVSGPEGPETSVSVTFQQVRDGKAVTIADLVPVEAASRTAFYGNAGVGLAVANPHYTATAVEVSCKGTSTTVSLTLPPQGQMARLLGELFPDMKSGDDLIEVVAGSPVAVLPLAMKVDESRLVHYSAVTVVTAK